MKLPEDPKPVEAGTSANEIISIPSFIPECREAQGKFSENSSNRLNLVTAQ